MFKLPILFLVFNRPKTTALVFERIREIKPKYLYIAADGPREGKIGEKELCTQVRQIVTGIDWPCQVTTLFREKNLGCKLAVSGGITWFFDHVEEGIILEDDCYPSLSFFHFCEAMLDMYRGEDKIFHVGGNNFQDGQQRSANSHYFSKYTHIWGWATYRRAWKFYELKLQSYPSWSTQSDLKNWFSSHKEMNYWIKKFKKFYDHPDKLTTWDYQWLFTVWLHKGISIIPEVNLVKNIGIGSGTHTFSSNDHLILKNQDIKIPFNKNQTLDINQLADIYYFKNYVIYKGSFASRIQYRMKKITRAVIEWFSLF